jgi:hypothetical protein
MEQNQKGEVTITRSVCQKFAPEFNADLISSILVASNGIRDMIEKSPTKAPVHSIRPDNRPQPSA